MSTTPAPADSARRHAWLAVALLAVLLCLVSGVFHRAWWVPWQAERGRLLKADEALSRARSLLAQKESVAGLSLRVEAEAQRQRLWLTESTVQQGEVELARRIDEVVTRVRRNGKSCRMESRAPVRLEPAPASDRPGRAGLSVRLRCGNAEMLRVLAALELQAPRLRIDSLNISGMPAHGGTPLARQAGVLDVGFVVIGGLSPAGSARAEPGQGAM
ncbi:hypothetical protein EBB59_04100 [Lysobacter pythonis]|uniref:General secretion pathway protein GspM n=1 Tax=Solilutibacter pythonis TaxID=2483112 RepID=A0A3M2I3P1_9GAMM|nr:type II secretion system protein GspM [Lysobacter pythonis]RMH93832.1 hypothetical protein EBB59_04100 [Lysobacter pythonis]